jgi:hypothetical protein
MSAGDLIGYDDLEFYVVHLLLIEYQAQGLAEALKRHRRIGLPRRVQAGLDKRTKLCTPSRGRAIREPAPIDRE